MITESLPIKEGLGGSSRPGAPNSLQIATWPDSAEHLRAAEGLDYPAAIG
jgi:hypothetical protein